MSERYSRLFSLQENLYSEGSPVVIAAGALLKDNETGKVLAQLKLRSICHKPIKAATVSILPYDVAGNPLGDAVEYQYLDIKVTRDGEFGQKTPVVLPNTSTRAYSVTVSEVIFVDNTIWHDDGPEWKPLPKQQTLGYSLGSDDLAMQFRIKHGNKSKYSFQEYKDLWQCSCGSINRKGEAECHNCAIDFKALKEFDLEELHTECVARLAETQRKIEEADAAAKAKVKKTKKLIAIITPVVIVAIIAGGIFSVSIQKKQQEAAEIAAQEAEIAAKEESYNKAIQLMNSGNALEAYSLFSELGDYKDAGAYVLREQHLLSSEHFASYDYNRQKDKSGIRNYYYNAGKLERDEYIGEMVSSRTNGVITAYSDVNETNTYSYDADGHLTLSVRIQDVDGHINKWEYEYNEYGDIIKGTYTSGSYRSVHTYKYEYNADGLKTSSKLYYDNDVNPAETHTYSYQFDAQGRVLEIYEEEYVDAFNETYNYVTANKYDESGNLFESVKYFLGEDGKRVLEETTYIYTSVYWLERH